MRRSDESALRAVALNFAATREDLHRIADSLDASPTPRLRDFVPGAMAILDGRTRDTYRHHVDRLVANLGERRLDEVSLMDLELLATEARAAASHWKQAKHGYGAQESFVNATRFVFNAAVKAGHLVESPASGLTRPRRRRSPRRALTSDELSRLFEGVLSSSRDPELDLLILAVARETACRREGILNLRVGDVHPTPSVTLYEKFDERREIPVTDELRRALLTHALARSDGCDRVFHYRSGGCLTDRRFDVIFTRLGEQVSWARALGVSLHWLRYTTLTDIRLVAGERVAAAYAGHGDGAGGITALYTRATFAELQRAHRIIFGGG